MKSCTMQYWFQFISSLSLWTRLNNHRQSSHY